MSNQNNGTLAKYSPKQVMNSQKAKKKFEEILGKKAQGFLASVLQCINDSKMLEEASSDSVYHAAMTAAVLDLPINPNLGFAYILPYRNKGGTVAQFQLGYKGFIQLCQRSGKFKTISAAPIYEGQLIKENPLTGFEFDFNVRSGDDVIGYASYFALLNGFEKTLYMTVEEIEQHAKKYSQSYKKGYGPWVDNFEAMAIKTVLKLLLSKYAPMTIEMEKAMEADQAEIKDSEGMEVGYVDNDQHDPQQPTERPEMDITPSMDEMQNSNSDLPFK